MQSQTDNLVRDGIVESFWTEFVSYWRRLPNALLFLILLGAWLLLFQFLGNGTFGYIKTASLFRWMWNAYNNPIPELNEGHGNVVPLVVLGLMWWKRKELFAAELRSWVPGLFLFALAVALHLAAYLVQQPKVSILAFFAGLYALMGMAWGPKWLRHCFFPFVLFVFAVPLGDVGLKVTFPLRLFVSGIVEFVGRNLMGLDLVREGTQLTSSTHAYNYDVAAACSGIRSLFAIFFICTAYGYVVFRRSWQWVVMTAAAFPLAVIGNSVRLLTVVTIAAKRGHEAGKAAHDDTFLSILPYVPAVIGVVYLARWLQDKLPELLKQKAKS